MEGVVSDAHVPFPVNIKRGRTLGSMLPLQSTKPNNSTKPSSTASSSSGKLNSSIEGLPRKGLNNDSKGNSNNVINLDDDDDELLAGIITPPLSHHHRLPSPSLSSLPLPHCDDNNKVAATVAVVVAHGNVSTSPTERGKTVWPRETLNWSPPLVSTPLIHI
jgi:hypothetical protein